MWILCNNFGKNLTYLKPPDTVQRPSVSSYGVKTFLCIFWKSSGFLHDRVSEVSLMATPYAMYHKLINVARKYCPHYDKTSENCGSLHLEEYARNYTANQRKITFVHWIVPRVASHHIVPTWLQTIPIQFVLYKASKLKNIIWHGGGENLPMVFFDKGTMFFYYSNMHIHT